MKERNVTMSSSPDNNDTGGHFVLPPKLFFQSDEEYYKNIGDMMAERVMRHFRRDLSELKKDKPAR